MIEIKNKEKFDFNFNKATFITIETAILLTIVILVCIVLKGDISLKNSDETKNGVSDTIENSIVYKEGLTFAPTQGNESNQDEYQLLEKEELLQEYQAPEKYEPMEGYQSSEEQLWETKNNVVIDDSSSKEENKVSEKQKTPTRNLDDPSGWTTEKIISKAKEAVNKTKAYTDNLTVNHSEGFVADVTECTGGEIVKGVVNLMVGWIVKPVNETLVYQNGRAVNSEGETVPVLLPKRNAFSLTESGVKSASVSVSGNEYVIKINLVEESVGMYDVPKHNAASVGYLDVANFDISFMEVDSADIVYKGSSIELRINADGYVTYANYKIPLHINGAAHKGSISGSATIEGEQTEEWKLNF